MGFRFHGLGVRENHEEEEGEERRKEKLPWVRSLESMVLRAAQSELRAAQMQHNK